MRIKVKPIKCLGFEMYALFLGETMIPGTRRWSERDAYSLKAYFEQGRTSYSA